MQEFIEKFKNLFDDPPEVEILTSTKFKELAEWDSLVALSFIVMASNEYGRSIDGAAIRRADTVDDLFQLLN
jgi:acyl carrier protein